jgi:glycosyltransferase involved in cell wall biosynthesis
VRVAYLLHQSGVGSERLLVRLLSSLDRGRVDPLVVLPGDGPIRAEVEALGVPVRVSPLSWWIPSTHWDAAAFLAQLEGLHERAAGLASLLRSERVELVHTFFIVTLEGAMAAAQIGVPHVWHSRGFFGNGFPPAYFDDVTFLLSVVDLLADAVLCMSRGIEAQMATVCQRTDRRVIYDGYDFAAFLDRPAPDRAALRTAYGIAANARVIATVGGIQRRKGQLDLVEAAAPLVREVPDLILAIAGEGTDAEFRARLDTRIADLGLQKHFRFVGFERDIFNLLSISDMLVHPSHSEGFGIAILEAMAVGLPVVATRCGGPEEMIESGKSGLLVPVSDPAALSAAMRAVLADPAQGRRLGETASRSIRAFSLENTALATESAYRHVLEQYPRDPAVLALRERIAHFAAEEVLHRAGQAPGHRGNTEETQAAGETGHRGNTEETQRKR